MGINLKETVALTGALMALSFAGMKMAERNGPEPRPEYTLGTEEVNRKVNNVLIGGAERECLTTGRLNEIKFKQNRKDLLGNQEGDVRVWCKQVKDQSDRVFTLQIGDETKYTRGGNIYKKTGNIVQASGAEK